MTCVIVFLPYLPLSLSWPFTTSSHGSWRWGWGGLCTLSLLRLILSPCFPFCFISSNLLLLFLLWFDSQYFVPVSPLSPFWLHQILVPDDVYQILSFRLPKMQRILFIISSLVKIIILYFTESKWQSRVSGL